MGMHSLTIGSRGELRRMTTRGAMRLWTLWDDVVALIWLDIPASLRLAVFILCLLVAYATGMMWAMSVGYQVEVVRAQAGAELVEVRAHMRHLWHAYEAVRTRQDRHELESSRELAPLTATDNSKGE